MWARKREPGFVAARLLAVRGLPARLDEKSDQAGDDNQSNDGEEHAPVLS